MAIDGGIIQIYKDLTIIFSSESSRAALINWGCVTAV